MTWSPQLPRIENMTRAQYSGWACCWCSASLAQRGGVSAGRAMGGSGVHTWTVEVYACSPCALARPSTNSRPGR